EGERARRRRRGRRGGRRTRDDAGRPADVYAWAWPARPVGDDPYQWRGPVQAQQAPEPAGDVRPPAPVAEAFAAPEPGPAAPTEPSPQPSLAEDAAAVDVWVELPVAEEAPRKGRTRRPRSRGAAAAAAEAAQNEPAAPEPTVAEPPAIVAEEAVTPPVVAEPVPLEIVEEAAAPAEAAPGEAAPLEAVAAVADIEETPSPAPVDAAEIVAPPPTPRRGWWRRGA
ncbi:MAG TPA: ribonuclease E/G, partial [Caulobacteraceae bacterium]|nr:ribonuclease E/G [Caulobacteraceae bacterium]